MSKHELEQISSLMDDEQIDYGTIDALCKDKMLQQIWGRYHLVRDCLRGNLTSMIDLSVADQVKSRLDEEATIVTPEFTQKSFPKRLLKPAAGMAIAASVATVAILGLQQDKNIRVTDNTIPIASNLSGNQAQLTFVAANSDSGENTTENDNQVQSKLDHYLVNYNEHRSNSGMRGILPYVRIVAYETEE